MRDSFIVINSLVPFGYEKLIAF